MVSRSSIAIRLWNPLCTLLSLTTFDFLVYLLGLIGKGLSLFGFLSRPYRGGLGKMEGGMPGKNPYLVCVGRFTCVLKVRLFLNSETLLWLQYFYAEWEGLSFFPFVFARVL
ncbi:hypothetical protein TWF594_006081 [Orbilia oligospora]|nr:hypothetical protein TWF706_005914 [Orbilia oligospora]KAF3141528.1 hypothetical protein TWF594_006081 [Orbilia oligospora]